MKENLSTGACPSGTKLSDWGQCVSWFRGGPSFRGVSAAGSMAFSYDYVGPNAHMCSLSGRADKVNALWIFQDDGSTCALRIEVNSNGCILTLNEDNQITRIDICTIIPDPETAVRLSP